MNGLNLNNYKLNYEIIIGMIPTCDPSQAFLCKDGKKLTSILELYDWINKDANPQIFMYHLEHFPTWLSKIMGEHELAKAIIRDTRNTLIMFLPHPEHIRVMELRKKLANIIYENLNEKINKWQPLEDDLDSDSTI